MNENKNIFEYYSHLNKSIWIDWIFKILYSLEFILVACTIQEEHYPDACFALLFIAIWLYFFKLRILAIVPLLFAFFINYVHVPH